MVRPCLNWHSYSGRNPYATPEQTRETIRRFIDSYADPRFCGWAIEREGGIMTGTIGTYDYDPEKQQIEVGFSINGAVGARAMPLRHRRQCRYT